MFMHHPPAQRHQPPGKSLQRLLPIGLALCTITAATLVFGAKGQSEASLQITSSAFAQGGAIPKRYTCDGADRSPPLSWSGVPIGTKSLVLIVDDPDAPDPAAPRTTWVHWVLFNLPPESSGLEESITTLPAGTGKGLNDWKATGYRGPCPPIGRHRYLHKLFALDTDLKLEGAPTKAEVVRAMRGHVLAEAVLVGAYRR
jgi:Raf kinase inhibitor-like YbhB/YbcL family protein